MYYHLSVSNNNFQNYAPNNLLLSEVAMWGSENGFNNFHPGGELGGQEDSLFKFKKAFNKYDPNTFYLGEKFLMMLFMKNYHTHHKRNLNFFRRIELRNNSVGGELLERF